MQLRSTIVAWLGLCAAFGQTQEPQRVVRMNIRPAAESVPALRYELMPGILDQGPGNAAMGYSRAFSPEWFVTLRRPGLSEKILESVETPLRELPRKELDLLRTLPLLQELDRAARRSTCDFEMAARIREHGIHLLIPEMQAMRLIGTCNAVRARLELADGRFDQAQHSLQTGFALARHLGECPVLVISLVGTAMAQSHLNVVEDWIRAPGSPNLYWALTNLPQPFLDFHQAMELEVRAMILVQIPRLRDLEKAHLSSPELLELRDQTARAMHQMAGSDSVDWQAAAAVAGWTLRYYAEAKRDLIASGMPAAEIESMPTLQVVLIHGYRRFRTLQDDAVKCFRLPYWEAQPRLLALEKDLRASGQRSSLLPFQDYLPNPAGLRAAMARTERRIAILRCVEAIRAHAAAHDGKLPAKLTDIREVPIPTDPMTGKSFDYQLEGDLAVLRALPLPGDPPVANSLRYELTLAR